MPSSAETHTGTAFNPSPTSAHGFAESVAADLDIPDLLDHVTRHAHGALLVKTDMVDFRLGSGARHGVAKLQLSSLRGVRVSGK